MGNAASDEFVKCSERRATSTTAAGAALLWKVFTRNGIWEGFNQSSYAVLFLHYSLETSTVRYHAASSRNFAISILNGCVL